MLLSAGKARRHVAAFTTILMKTTVPTRLVPHLIYTPARGFEEHVSLTSTTGFSRHDRATCILLRIRNRVFIDLLCGGPQDIQAVL